MPAGTVLVLDDVPIRAEEVDEVGSAVAILEPQDSPLELRKLALTLSIFPRVAARSIDPAARETARKQAEIYVQALEKGTLPSGPLSGPIEMERTGTFRELGLDVWRATVGLEPGRWSGIVESPGCFHVVRVKSRKEASLATMTSLTIGAFDFPFVQIETAKADLEAAYDRSRLVIVDPTWRDAVPATWRYRLHVENP